MLDFGATPFPVLEGQSIGILPPGADADGRAHLARQYSIASPRDGERPGYNNVALTVKRVTADHDGAPVRGVCSNYLCDLDKGDAVQVIGPFGNTFLMPNHPGAHLLMICTGTGSAPMRAMTERRRRRRGKDGDGKLMLFFGARTQQELPYFGPLMNLPPDFIDINLAFSRVPGAPKRYVQDLMRERARRRRRAARRRRHAHLRLRPEGHGGGRARRAARTSATGARPRLVRHLAPAEDRRPPAFRDVLATQDTMTWSIVARDATALRRRRREPVFRRRCAMRPYARGGRCAATQALVNPGFGPAGLDLLADGVAPEDVVAALIAAMPDATLRQVHVIGARGRPAAYTGDQCVDWCGHVIDEDFPSPATCSPAPRGRGDRGRVRRHAPAARRAPARGDGRR